MKDHPPEKFSNQGDTPSAKAPEGGELRTTASRGDVAHSGPMAKWPLLLLVIAATVGGAIWYANRPSGPVPLPEIPEAKFTDITAGAGIGFVHNNGAYGDKLLPETMGGGVAFFDFDNNGTQDLLFINSTWWPWHIPAGKPPTTL